MKKNSGYSEQKLPFKNVVEFEQLRCTPFRAANFEIENQILVQLTRQASEASEDLLQVLTNLVSALYDNVSACVSLSNANDETSLFRWVALSSTHADLTNPRDGKFGFPDSLKTHQVLRLPFFVNGFEAGTLWVLSHDKATDFDQEDFRILSSAAAFGAIALQLNNKNSAEDIPEVDHKSFLAQLSHDMRSPLGAIIGFSELLKTSELSSSEKDKFLGVIGRNAQSLLNMVDTILSSPKGVSSPEAAKTFRAQITGKTILVVEDLLDNRILLGTILRSEGAEVDFAFDGQEGVQKALCGNYDIIVMDIQMPVMDGYEALLKIREAGCLTPAVALTANTSGRQREVALAKGFHGFFNKPIPRVQFIDFISKIASEEKKYLNKSEIKVATGPSVLVVEDDADVRELIEFVSVEAGARTSLAGSGQEALKILEDGFSPDLVFLDLTLPDMGGAEVISAIRKDTRWNKAKVILLSGKDNLATHAAQLGASGSLMKPFDIDQIESLISDFSKK